MWTAKLIEKDLVNGVIKVTVLFTNGNDQVTETCIPQDKNGFLFWVKSRLATFNSSESINTEYSVNSTIDVTEPAPEAPTATQLTQQAWFSNYMKLQGVQKLIDLGVLKGNETSVVNLRNKVKTGFLPAYIDNL